MASLRSIILDGRYHSAKDLTEDEWAIERQYAGIARYQLASSDTILVNATSVARDVFDGGMPDGWADWSRIPCPKPPFHKMWLEMIWHECRFGCLTQRIDVPSGKDPIEAFARRNVMMPVEYSKHGEEAPDHLKQMLRRDPGETIEAFAQVYDANWERPIDFTEFRQTQPYGGFPDSAASIVSASLWIEQLSSAGRMGTAFWFLDSEGVAIGNYVAPWPNHGENIPPTGAIGGLMLWAMHVFARMNCHNVRLQPMRAGAPAAKQIKKHGPPSTVWHEIAVTGLPELRRERGETAPDGEKRELRFHKVRGHYADYTKGKGLFGKWKLRIWIEEHEAGSDELGSVTSSYRVE